MIAGSARSRDWPFSRSGSQTLSNTVAHGISVGSWNTKPSSCSWSRQLIQPRVGAGQAGEQAQDRRLAAARGAEQRQELAAPHFEVDAGQRHGAVGEGLVDAFAAAPAAARAATAAGRRVLQRRAHFGF